jgi:hypothetical protein
MTKDIDQFELRRDRLYQELSQVGDLRRGSLEMRFRRCGKTGCACAKTDHPGHGPQYLLMNKLDGKSVCKNLHPGAELEKVTQEVANYKRFRELSKNIIEINERICDIKDAEVKADVEATAKKGASKPASKRKSSPKSVLS